VELADAIIRIGTLAYVLQLKERSEETGDPELERRWFRRKVIDKATSKSENRLRYLSEQDATRLTNEQGHIFDLRGAELNDIKKIIVFQGSKALPSDCWTTQYHVSESIGFIHILAVSDHVAILDYFRVPDDIRRYFEYRESVLPPLREARITVEEPYIMVAYLSDAELPVPRTRDRLRDFIQDLEDFDLSYILNHLLAQIQNQSQNHGYYQILLEFARVPRSLAGVQTAARLIARGIQSWSVHTTLPFYLSRHRLYFYDRKP
jgi:hypothetical protein